jgi:hypothetical protein
MTMDFMFEDAESALRWGTEMLRRRRWPKMSSIWTEVTAEAEWIEDRWLGTKLLGLPEDHEGRLALALRVERAMAALENKQAEAARMLRLWAMGDWADEVRLRAALAIQEKARREGLRVRLSYRYTYAQLAAMLGCDRKAAWRLVMDALALLHVELVEVGLLPRIVAPYAESKAKPRKVRAREFEAEDTIAVDKCHNLG